LAVHLNFQEVLKISSDPVRSSTLFAEITDDQDRRPNLGAAM
jgi:hypothetical protein